MPSTKVAQKSVRKATAGKKTSVLPEFVLLPDGTQIPVKIPPGMSVEQAQAVVAYLQANPEAAKAAHEQAQGMLQSSPGMAAAYATMLQQQPSSDAQQVYEALKGDEELQAVFEDVKQNGPAALQKYWSDTELMSKISQRLRKVQLQAPDADAAAAGGAGADGRAPPPPPPAVRKQGPPQPPAEISNLHEAAKWGDVEATQRLLAAGHDPNCKNERGVSALGVAVGFNRHDVVQALLDHGADVALTDAQGNTPLHYAAGYGRKQILEQLLGAGADAGALNGSKQRAVDVAKLNGETAIVKYLEGKAAVA